MKLIFRLAVFFALAVSLAAAVVPYQRQQYTTNIAGVRLGQGTFTNLSVRETGAGAYLNFVGAVANGEFLQRVGTNIVGAAALGGGDFFADGSVPMTGDLDLGGNDVTNAGTFYGVASEASHATNADNATYATNLPAGALGIDLTLVGDLDMWQNDITNVGFLTVNTNATVKNDLIVGNDLTVTNDATVTGDLSVGGTLTVDEVDTDTLVITNSLTVSNMYVNTMVVTNAISGGSLSTTTNVTSAAVTGTNTVTGGVVTATTNVSSPVIYGGAITGTNTISGGVITATTNFSSPILYAGAVTGTNSGTFGTLLSVTNAAITWGVEAVTQSGGTNYTLPFAGTASYPNTYLAYTMTGNVCFAFTTNRLAGRCRTVILYGNGKNGRLDFNSDNHLVGALANGIVVTNTYILSFWTGGTYETNVFISGQYAE